MNRKERRKANALAITVAAVVALAMPASAAEIVAEGDTISITGQIEQDDYAHFRDALTAKPQTRVVILNSLGGRLTPAITIGREIRARKIATLIPDGAFCSSACAMIWLGGIPRDIHGNGRLGFHSRFETRAKYRGKTRGRPVGKPCSRYSASEPAEAELSGVSSLVSIGASCALILGSARPALFLLLQTTSVNDDAPTLRSK